MTKAKKALKRIFDIIRKPEMVILPGNVAFSIILGIFPAIMILGFIIYKFNITVDYAVGMFRLNIPEEILEIVRNFLNVEANSNTVIFVIILALVFASNGANSIIVAANILYKKDESSKLHQRLKSLFMIIVLTFLISFSIIVIGFGTAIIKMFIDSENLYIIFAIARVIISFVIIFSAVKIIYIISPAGKIPSKTVNRGSLFTTIGWIVTTYIYSFYVNNIARYDIFYGNLSAIIILMIWIFILSEILVIGMSINAEQYNYLKEHKSLETQK